MIRRSGQGLHPSWGDGVMCVVVDLKLGQRTGCQSCDRTIGATGQDDRNTRPHDNARRIRPGKIDQLLGDHIGGFKIRCDENIGIACDIGNDALGFCSGR